jgi:hypothetical protein
MHYMDAATRLKKKESCVLSIAKINHSSQKTEVFAKKKLRFSSSRNLQQKQVDFFTILPVFATFSLSF